MTSGTASSSVMNTSVFKFDEIETDDRLRLFVHLFNDVNDVITQDRLGVDDVNDRNDAFLARLQAMDPTVVKMYDDRKYRNFAAFSWLRLPQPSKGIAGPCLLSIELQRLMQILEEASRFLDKDHDFKHSYLQRKLAHAFHGCQLDEALSIR